MKKRKLKNRPMLFLQLGDLHSSFPYHFSRIRIIYSDGTSEWLNYGNEDITYSPCWANDLTYNLDGSTMGQDSTRKVAIKRMRAYDKRIGYLPAEFLGYL